MRTTLEKAEINISIVIFGGKGRKDSWLEAVWTNLGGCDRTVVLVILRKRRPIRFFLASLMRTLRVRGASEKVVGFSQGLVRFLLLTLGIRGNDFFSKRN